MPLAIASGMVKSERAKLASAPRIKNRITGDSRVSMGASLVKIANQFQALTSFIWVTGSRAFKQLFASKITKVRDVAPHNCMKKS